MRRDPKLEPGHLVASRYRLLDGIGRGSMGAVWRAEDVVQGREVAVKIVRPRDEDGKPSTTAVGRFMREFRAMERLRSPHVVRVFHHGSDSDLVFIVMELLTGISLRDRLRRDRRLDARTTLRVLRHVGRAVALAHQLGIVHRDLKPANIFLCNTPEGGVVTKVLDFGMAKSLSTPLNTVDPVRTELGRPIGTPYYMSPEQARGTMSVDQRSDLWAIGVLAYECLCGVRPFIGKSLVEVFTNIASAPVPVPSSVAELPPAFDTWFARAVERDVQKRFQTAKLMLEELQEALGEAGLSSTSTSPLTIVGGTMSEAIDTMVQPPGFGDRTLRRAPPPSGTSFVGREQEIAALYRAIESHSRVLTLTGPDGIGRSRVLRELGTRLSGEMTAGTWHCDLGGVSDAEGMWLKLAATLGVRLSEGDAARRVGRALGGMGRTLLVLERADEVRDHLAPALARWLSDAPQALFGITARRALEVPTERVVPIFGLELPNITAQQIGELTRSAASQLLLRRVIGFERRVLSDDAHAQSLTSICHATGGHPLALELVSSSAANMPLATVAHSLATSLVNLDGTAIIQPERSATLALLWRCEQLAPLERATLVQCGVFCGSFSMQAAEAVVDLTSVSEKPELSVAELVQSLERLGLLRKEAGAYGDDRYHLHPMLRATCLELLAKDTNAEAAVRLRHARYYAQLGSDEALEALSSRGGSMRRARYDVEWDNVVAGLEHAGSRGEADTVAALALATAAVLMMHGRPGSAARQLLRGIMQDSVSEQARLRCLVAQGEALATSRRPDAAEDVLSRAISLARQLGNESRLATGLRAQARVHITRARFEEARAALDEASHLSARHGDRLGRTEAQRIRAELEAAKGSNDAASAQLKEAVHAYRELSARQLEAETLGRLGLLALEGERGSEGRQRIEEAIVLHRELGNRHLEAELVGRLGEWTSEQAGAEDEARALLEHASGRSRELGACDLEGRFLATLAAFKPSGNFDRAFYLMQQAEQLVRGDGGGEQLVVVMCRRAQLELISGRRDLSYATQRELDARRAQLDAAATARVKRVVERLQRLLSGA
ncbi:MAG TPA: protein kinase [Polyangiaceae bacterium]|nr:protein kinase [Polyangiaceae bacterium]